MTKNPNSEELFEQGSSLVYSLASKIRRSIPFRVELEDLIAYGQVGLYEAIRDFKATQGVKFTTYAYIRIRGAIYDGIGKMSWTSRARYRRERKFQQMAREVIAEDEKSVDPKTAEEAARWLTSMTRRLGVVYLASNAEDDTDDPLSRVESPGQNAYVIVANREVINKLSELIKRLPNEQARLIRMIYFEGETLQGAADQIGISKSWASRQHAKILENLGRSLRELEACD